MTNSDAEPDQPPSPVDAGTVDAYGGYGPPPDDGVPRDAGYLEPNIAGPGYQYVNPQADLDASLEIMGAELKLALSLAGVALSFVDGVAEIQEVVAVGEAAVGYDLTGKKLSTSERALTLALATVGQVADSMIEASKVAKGVAEADQAAEAAVEAARLADGVRAGAIAAGDAAKAPSATLAWYDKLDEAGNALAAAAATATAAKDASHGAYMLKATKELVERLEDAKTIIEATQEFALSIPSDSQHNEGSAAQGDADAGLVSRPGDEAGVSGGSVAQDAYLGVGLVDQHGQGGADAVDPHGGVGLVDYGGPEGDGGVSGGSVAQDAYLGVGLVDQHGQGGADASPVDPHGGVGLVDYGGPDGDGGLPANALQPSMDQGLVDPAHQLDHHGADDTPDPGNLP